MNDATTTQETLSIVVEREFAHPPEKLWRALTQPHLIEEWLMKSDFQPQLGHRFQLRGDWGGILDCEVLAIELNRKLAYSWNFDDPANGLQTVVTFTLTPSGAGTRLHMEQAGFRPDRPQNYNGAKYGWQQFFGKLETLLARPE
jgi:uncharacterized protein YndB with AHSA1/START domain